MKSEHFEDVEDVEDVEEYTAKELEKIEQSRPYYNVHEDRKSIWDETIGGIIGSLIILVLAIIGIVTVVRWIF